MSRDLGTSKSGQPILARGCAEDNSGVMYFEPAKNAYIVRMTYPIGQEEDGEYIYDLHFPDRQQAVDELRAMCGSFGEGE